MPLDRKSAVDYATRFWNRVCDDDMIAISSGVVSLADKRKSMKAPASDGWEGWYVSDGNGNEKAVFGRVVNGKVVSQADPIFTWDFLDDCTHYVCRCLLAEGVKLTQTSRANELTEEMIKSSQTKTLAVRASRKEGQRVIDSGIFKPGDMVGYYTEKKGRYTHTAMFVGRAAGGADDPGGITCHSLCRFEGKTQAWNGATDDAWFLHEGLSYTLIHFAEDDATVTSTHRGWLEGWWKVGSDFYFIRGDGHAFSTLHPPTRAGQTLSTGKSIGYYFDTGRAVIMIWRKPGGKVQVEQWAATGEAATASLTVDGVSASAVRFNPPPTR